MTSFRFEWRPIFGMAAQTARLAGCAKLSVGLWGLAMLWAYRREPK